METIVLRFTDFWNGFNQDNNFFRAFFENELGMNVRIAKFNENADIEFVSTFHYSSKLNQIFGAISSKFNQDKSFIYSSATKHGIYLSSGPKRARLRIWFSGENFRYTPDSADGYICFDESDDSENVFHFPYWMYRLDWGFNSPEFVEQAEARSLHRRRSLDVRKRNVCMFSNTREPGKMKILKAVEQVLPVEKFGSAFRNPVANKYEISRTFGLQICPENSIYPGYVTEKLIEAWHCGNVPIWQGLDFNQHFNPEAIIDVTHLNVEEISELIRNITNDELMHKRSLNILRHPASLQPFRNFIIRLMNAEL